MLWGWPPTSKRKVLPESFNVTERPCWQRVFRLPAWARPPIGRLRPAAALLAACAGSASHPPVWIEGLRFVNHGTAAVTEATLRVEATQEFVACGYIPVRGECSTKFPLRVYRANPVRVIWAQGARRFQSEAFVVSPPAAINPHQPLTATITLRDDGGYAARLDW